MLDQVNCVLVDVQNMEIISRENISSAECDLRNSEARSVGEIFLQWHPSDSLSLVL
jgi:hypothetical protein